MLCEQLVLPRQQSSKAPSSQAKPSEKNPEKKKANTAHKARKPICQKSDVLSGVVGTTKVPATSTESSVGRQGMCNSGNYMGIHEKNLN